MKKQVRMFATLLALGFLLAGCMPSTPPAAEEPGTQVTGTLYVNREISDDFAFTEHPFTAEVSGELSPEILAAELTALTGLSFSVVSSPREDGVALDWAETSTLITGIDAREEAGDFVFPDSNTLRWSMMDSLWKTVTENLDVENVYYTMGGGEDLNVDGLMPYSLFPADLPYVGSPFFFHHVDGRGGEE